MALGTALGALAAGAASAAGSTLAGKLLGGKSKAPEAANFRAPGFNAGGLSAKAGPKGFTVSSSAGRNDIIGQLAATFPEQAAALRDLRAKVAPGMSDLRKSRLDDVENARSRAIGDLRNNLQARRVMGSSFASDALARAEAEFSKERDRISSESFMQELTLTHGLLNEEFTAGRGEFATRLSELNLQADIATKLAANATATLGELTKAQMEIAMKQSEGAGLFAGKIIEPIVKTIGTEVTNAMS